jgi:hypothetical protein
MRMRRFSLILSFALGACDGQIFAGAGGGNGSVTGPGDGAVGAGPSKCTGLPLPVAAPLRRLNNSEYDLTVADLLGDTTQPAAASFPADAVELGFDNNADVSGVSELWWEQVVSAADQLAATAAVRAGFVPCAASAGEACATQFISAFGLRAFRRPLTSDESANFLSLWRAGTAQGSFTTGVQWVVQAALMSPQFLYRPELDSTAPNLGTGVPLTSYEVATRLSYLLWGSMPDDALLAAAGRDELTDRAQVATQASRLLAAPRARDAVRRFYSQWLSLPLLDNMIKDTTRFPAYTPTMGASMRQSLEKFIDDAIWSGNGGARAMLTSNVAFVDASLAGVYGIAPGTGWQRVQLDSKQRAGLMTQLGMLSINAHADQDSPVRRGKFVREQIFCQMLPPPPANLKIQLPVPDPTQTTRQRFAQHATDPACSACHHLMDPVGLGFEHYDAIGRWRDTENNLPVDDSGSLTGTDVDGDFHGAVELAGKVSGSALMSACTATQWFRSAYGRTDGPQDACSIDELQQKLAAAGGDVKAMLVAMVQTDTFLHRP